ncbi:ATP-binding protein [Ornithinimicrobium cerasi]|uniref:ATP-binding protein n=1 Tax=Ornithinimicrobium cerasi TaxID=2248773 RepID=UPI000F006CBE|nr:ATP-binding protein [Ornithinimicrobium cerasi]
MRLPLLPAVLLALAGAAGAVVNVALARVQEPDRVPVDEVCVAVVVLAYGAVSVLVAAARPRHLVGRLLATGSAAWGLGEGSLALGLHLGAGDAAAWAVTLGTASRALGWLTLVIVVPFVLPDGRAPWPGRRLPGAVVGGAVALFTLATLLAPVPLDRRASGVRNPTGLPEALRPVADTVALAGLAACVAALVVAIAGLVHRWRTGDTLRQQQLLWLALAFVPPVLLLPLLATDLARPWLFALVSVPVPVAVAVAVLQRRLYDVQLAVSRTLTYLALSAVVALLYAATVAGAGAVLDERGADWLPWLAAGVVAVTFAPLRDALQRGVSRLTYGQWAEPGEVLGATARRLGDAADVPALLGTLADELATTLRLDRVEIRDAGGAVLAAAGREGADLQEDPLTAYGRPVGSLLWARRSSGLRDADRRLLDDVESQLGGVVHAAGLVEGLRGAQHRLVLAREEERRRLRRDLHDGLGPSLASLTLNVDELRNRWPGLEDPDAELLRLRGAVQAAVVDVRRIVEGLRPAPLSDLGLAGALEQLTARSRDTRVDLDVEELPELPAAVEVAAYRVVQEALSNALRHAHATTVRVVLRVVTGELLVEVLDDGDGTAAPRPGGVGLGSMRERAEELGGRLAVASSPGRGTRVRLELPLGAAAPQGSPLAGGAG